MLCFWLLETSTFKIDGQGQCLKWLLTGMHNSIPMGVCSEDLILIHTLPLG